MTATLLGRTKPQLTIVDNGDRTYQCTYRVKTTDAADGPLTACGASGLPAIGTQYAIGNESDPRACCHGVKGNLTLAQEDKSFKLWDVPIVWKTMGMASNQSQGPNAGYDDNQITDDSTEWKVTGDTPNERWALDSDIYGTAIRNSVNEPFSPRAETVIPLPVITIGRRTSFLPLLTWASVVYSINSTAYLGLDAYKVLVSKWSWTVGYRGNGSAYVDNHVELTIRWDTWLFKPVDQGYRVKHTTTPVTSAGLPNFKNIKVEGELPTEPFLLDGQGRILQSALNPAYL